MYDAAIIGGGMAGLQAALTLARGRRSVLLIDAGEQGHRAAAQLHNLIGLEGMTPAQFYAQAQAQLATYSTVTRVRATVTDAQAIEQGFALTDAQGSRYQAQKILFATGVNYVLPAIEGLAALWGSKVLHCAYCHGYEVRGKQVGVLTRAAHAPHLIGPLWPLGAQLRFFFQGEEPEAELATKLMELNIDIESRGIVAVSDSGEGMAITLHDGSTTHSDALFVSPNFAAASQLPIQLGCEMEYEAFIVADAWGRTSVPGVYAAGDMVAGKTHQLTEVALSGQQAALGLHSDLTYADIGL